MKNTRNKVWKVWGKYLLPLMLVIMWAINSYDIARGHELDGLSRGVIIMYFGIGTGFFIWLVSREYWGKNERND